MGTLKAPPNLPKMDYQVTNKPFRACSTYLSARNPFNKTIPEGKLKGEQKWKLTRNDIDWIGKDHGIFFHHQDGGVNVMCSKFSEECKIPEPPICRGRTRTRCTQTRYRESSAQTHPYQPEVAGNKEIYKNFEVYEVSKLLSSLLPPGEYEAKVVERARRRRQYKKALELVINDKAKHRALLEAMEWEDWVAREEDIQGCQMLRMQVVLKMFEEREAKFNTLSAEHITCSNHEIQTKRSFQLKKINIEFGRSMRRLENRRQKITRNYRKANITKEHIDAASDLHAPQMRYGVNPNRRHFIGFRKNFDDRIDDLYKQKDDRGLASLTCPFSKLKGWAKPKERMKEVTQRFLSEENLKNLYENLKGLRAQAEEIKPQPKCLKKKVKPVQTLETEQHEKAFQHVEPEKPKIRLDELITKPMIQQHIEASDERLIDILHHKRFEELTATKIANIEKIVGEFEGSTLGTLLQLLFDELERLNNLKKFQTIQMLAERERWQREAAEAGLRQKENKLREDHQVLFVAAQEIHKDTARLFLQSVLEEEFKFTSEKMAEEKITELAKEIDLQDLDSIMLQGKDRILYNRVVIGGYVQNQVFGLAEKRLAKMKAEKLKEVQNRAIQEELFASVQGILAENYKTPDNVAEVGSLLDEMIVDSVVYDFDVVSVEDESEFNKFNLKKEVNEIINQILKEVIRPSDKLQRFCDSTEYQTNLEAKREARAIMGKLVKIAVPEERWTNQSERIVEQTLSDTFNDAIYDVECLKASRIVRNDDRLQDIIADIYNRMSDFKKKNDEKEEPIMEPSSSSNLSCNLRSIQSTMDIFDFTSPSTHSDSQNNSDSGSVKRTTYVELDKSEIFKPAEIGRRHERFDIRFKVAKRFQNEEKGGLDGDSFAMEDSDSVSDSTTTVEPIRHSMEYAGLGLTPKHQELEPKPSYIVFAKNINPELVASQRPIDDLPSARSYEDAQVRYTSLNLASNERKTSNDQRRLSL